MITVDDVSKSYDTAQGTGHVRALSGVSFHVDAGEVIGLLGPNGAGKTTMIKILTGYLEPDSGQVTVDGLDVLTHALEVQRRIGYLPENAPLYPEMSVQSYLLMIAALRQIPVDRRLSLLTQAVRATALEEHLARPIGELSKGYRQRVGLAQTILHRPGLLILDEPTAGLDPTQIVHVRHLIREWAQHSTVLLSTHILSEVEATCDRVIILMNGEVKADASLSALSATAGYVLTLEGPEPLPAVLPVLKKLPGVRSVTVESEGQECAYHVQGQEGLDLRPRLYQLARDQGWPLRELRRDTRTLEMVFNELATSAERTAAPVGAALVAALPATPMSADSDAGGEQ
jgi:gliding motility-associated transport system ATP-binding protein